MCENGKFKAFEHPQHSSNPWLNKGTWLGEIMRKTWNATDDYLINFGAHYDDSAMKKTMIDDVVAERMRRSDVKGLAVDADDKMRWAGAGVVTRTQFVEPATIGALLDGAAVPPRPLLLKIDIDSFDVLVARAVLASGRTPAFIYVEINEKVPPPACYCNDKFPTGRSWKRLDGDAFGCSLTGYVNAFREYGYALVAVHYNDALFARSDLKDAVAAELPGRALPDALSAWRAGYGDVPGVFTDFPWNYKNWPFHDNHVELAERLDAMEAYPAFRKGVDAGQATFARAAGDAWPCPAGDGGDPSAWTPDVAAAFAYSQSNIAIKKRVESKRFLFQLRDLLKKRLGAAAPAQPREAKAIGAKTTGSLN